MVNIESYGDILLYFCEFGNVKEILTLVSKTPSTGYNN